MKIRSANVLIIMVALIIVFFAIGILVVRRRIDEYQPTSTTQTTTPADTAAEAKTYINSEFGFQYSYPSSFSDPLNLNLTGTPATATSDYFSTNLSNPDPSQSAPVGSLIFNIKPLAQDEINLSLDDLVSRHSSNAQSQTDTTLGSQPAVELDFTAAGTISLGGVSTTVKNYNVIFVRDNNYLMWVELKPAGADSTDIENSFQTLLGTLVFTAISDAGTGGNSTTGTTATPPPTLQSFTIMADESAATPAEITVTAGTIVDLTFTVSSSNTPSTGLGFKTSTTDTGLILPGSSKTVAFTASDSEDFTPYSNTTLPLPYTVSVIVQ